MNKEHLPIVSETAMDEFIKVFRSNGATDEYIKELLELIVLTAIKKGFERNK